MLNVKIFLTMIKIDMKKIQVFLLFITLGFLSISNACSGKQNSDKSTQQITNEKVIPTTTAKIEFTLKGIDKGMAKMIGLFSDQYYIADSVMVEDGGHFVISRDSIYPEGYYYFILPGEKNISFLLDEDQHFKLTADTSNLDLTAKVEGSLCNKFYFDTKRFQDEINPKMRPLSQKLAKLAKSSPTSEEFKKVYKENQKYENQYQEHINWYVKNYPDNLFTKFKIAGRNPNVTYPVDSEGKLDTKAQVYNYRNQFWDGFDFTEEALIRTPAFSNKLKRFFTELIPLNQDSIIKYADILIAKIGDNKEYFKIVANWVTLHFEPGHTNLMDGEAVYVHMVENYFTPEKAFWAIPDQLDGLNKRAAEMEQSLIGKHAGNVTAKGYDGKMHTFFNSDADVIIIFIYNPNCEHCQEQTPELISFYNHWKNKGVEVFSIAANTNQKDWDKYHKMFNIPWVDVFDKTNASWYPKYFVDITPEIYVIDKDRKIVAKNLKVSQLDVSVGKALDKNK